MTHATHEWIKDDDGEVDIWQVAADYHNGPRCVKCGMEFCHHCEPECYTQECPA